MSERAKQINAILKISSARNIGTRVVVLLRDADLPMAIEEK